MPNYTPLRIRYAAEVNALLDRAKADGVSLVVVMDPGTESSLDAALWHPDTVSLMEAHAIVQEAHTAIVERLVEVHEDLDDFETLDPEDRVFARRAGYACAQEDANKFIRHTKSHGVRSVVLMEPDPTVAEGCVFKAAETDLEALVSMLHRWTQKVLVIQARRARDPH